MKPQLNSPKIAEYLRHPLSITYGHVMKAIIQKRKVASTVVVAGWEAAGSTFIWQVLKELGLNVTKHHGTWSNHLDRVVYTIRDPRDIICSHARRYFPEEWESGEYQIPLLKSLDVFVALKNIQSLYESIQRPGTLVIRYETFFLQNELLLIQILADWFMVPLSAQRLTNIASEFSIQSNLERASEMGSFLEWDKESYIHGMHITSGGKQGNWKQVFTPVVVDAVKEHLGDALILLGYEQDRSWSTEF